MSPLLLVSKNKLIWCSVLAFYVLLAEAIQCYTDDQTEQEMAATGYQTCSSYYNFKRKGRRILVTGEGFTGSAKNSTSPVFCEVYDHGDRGRAQLVIDDRGAKIAGIKKGSANCYCNTSFICHTQAETFKNYISRAGPEEKRILKHFLKKRGNLFCFSMLATCFPLTGTIYCYTDNSIEKVITKQEHRFCTGSYDFSKKPNSRWYSVGGMYFWYADVDSPLPVFCEVFDNTPPKKHEKIGRGKLRDITIAAIEAGTIRCYCNTSIICATRNDTFAEYRSSAGEREKLFTRRFVNLDVPEAVDELHKFMATSLLETTTEPSMFSGGKEGAESANPQGSNQKGQHSAAKAASHGSYDESSSPNLLLILGLGALVVLIIIVIIALVPILIKYRQKRRKKRLEKTWDQRVKQAGEELEKQKKEKEKKEAKSKGESSQESSTPIPSPGGRDPYEAFVSKMGHLDEKGAGV